MEIDVVPALAVSGEKYPNKENVPTRAAQNFSVEIADKSAPKRKILSQMDVFEPPKKIASNSMNQTASNSNYSMQIPHEATLQGQRQCIMASLLDSLKQEQELSRLSMLKKLKQDD